MPPAFRPLRGLLDRSEDPGSNLGWFRISAFPKFATTPEELVKWIDEASENTLETYRGRFRALLNSILQEQPTFAHRYRLGNSPNAVQLRPNQENFGELVVEWTEKDAADIFLPAASVVMCGHDDFGCNCVFDQSAHGAENWIRAKVAAAGLFCVQPPTG